MLENVAVFFQSNPLIFNILVVVASLAIVMKSADMLVYGISNYARKLGISDYLIGFIVVSIGTALPELVASITGATIGQGDIVFGTVFGSNLFKVPLLGIVILIAKKIKTNSEAVGSAPVITLFMGIAPVLLIYDGVLSRVDGIILLFLFIIYVMKLWHGEGEMGKIKKDIKLKEIYQDSIIFIGALAALLLSARWLVQASISISEQLKISPYIIGLLVIGAGASTPEMMVQVRSVLRKCQDIAFGNVLGSIVTNSTLVLGIVALIQPVFIKINVVRLTLFFIVVGVLYVLFAMEKEEVTLKDGIILLSLYLVFLAIEFVF